MVKRHACCPDTDPEQAAFNIPSIGEHLFQVVDIFDDRDNPIAMTLGEDIVCVKLEVVGGEEEGRSLLQRLSLDENWKGFFATRMFLKAIGEPHKGEIEIDTDRWAGRQFFATVKHVESKGKTYANIDAYNYEKQVEQFDAPAKAADDQAVNWD